MKKLRGLALNGRMPAIVVSLILCLAIAGCAGATQEGWDGPGTEGWSTPATEGWGNAAYVGTADGCAGGDGNAPRHSHSSGYGDAT